MAPWFYSHLCNNGNMENTAIVTSQTHTNGECLVSKNFGDSICCVSINSSPWEHDINDGDDIPPRYMIAGIATNRIVFSWTYRKF